MNHITASGPEKATVSSKEIPSQPYFDSTGQYIPLDYDKPLPGAHLTLRELNELVIEDSTEVRYGEDGVRFTIEHRQPLVLAPETPEMEELAKRISSSPAARLSIRRRTNELAKLAYAEEQRYLAELKETSRDSD